MLVKQHQSYLSNILALASTGVMAPAPMQRDYVWEKEDVEAFCKSLMKGYPIGSLLAWDLGADHEIEARTSRCGPVPLNRKPQMLLLDGQNRVGTLAWMLNPSLEVSDPSAAESRTWLSGQKLVLDAEHESILFLPAAEAESRLCYNSECFTSQEPKLIRERYTQLLNLGHSQEAVDELTERLDAVQRAILQAQIIMTTLVDATPEEAREAFTHIARAGVPISAEDFDRAVAWMQNTASAAGELSP